MPKIKKSFSKTPVNTKRRSQLEYFGKAAAAIAGMSLLPTIATSAVSFKKGTSGASTLWLADDGNVGIGTTSPSEKLHVESGAILAGTSSATGGSLILAGKYSGSNDYLNTFGSQYSSGGTVIGYGVRPRNEASGYVSATSINVVRSAIDMDGAISFLSAGVQTVAPGTAITMTTTMTIKNNGNIGIGTTNPTAKLDVAGDIRVTSGGKVYGAVWNDIADYLETDNEVQVEFGKVYVRTKQGETRQSVKPCEKGIIGIASDTYGMSVGKKGKSKKEIPIALAGIVLACCDKEYVSGTPLTASREGMVTKIYWWEKLLFPERIVATYYKPERSKKWNGVVVNGRHWVKIA